MSEGDIEYCVSRYNGYQEWPTNCDDLLCSFSPPIRFRILLLWMRLVWEMKVGYPVSHAVLL